MSKITVRTKKGNFEVEATAIAGRFWVGERFGMFAVYEREKDDPDFFACVMACQDRPEAERTARMLARLYK